MYPGRFWAALGTGEASNEHITGDEWPRKDVRNARLRECVDVIRALLNGEEVSHDGLVSVDRARIWTLPEEPPPLVGAAVSAATARWCAEWADGLITINQPVETLREIVGAYRDAGGRGRLHLQVHLSWDPDEQTAEEATKLQTSNGSNPESDWDQGYGYQFWRSRHGAYRGDGAFGQFCIVLPEQDAVVAITSGVRDMQAVLDLVWKELLPAMKPEPNGLPSRSAAVCQ